MPGTPRSLPTSVSNPSRLASLVNTGLLDSPIEEAFERLTQLAARTIHAPVSLVSLVDQERQYFKSAFGLPEPWLSKRETPLSHSFCKHVVETGAPLIISDARKEPLVQNNLAISALNVIAYAGMPLTLRNGQTLGSFCVIDHKPRVWTDDELDLLRDIATSVMTEIDLRLLLSAKEELMDVIFHDLKNPLSAILLNATIVQKKAGLIHDPALTRNADLIQYSSERMKTIIQDISDLNQIECGKLELKLEEQSVEQISKKTMLAIISLARQSEVKIQSSLECGSQMVCDVQRVSQAWADLISTSIKRSRQLQEIRVSIRQNDHSVVFEVSDRGLPLTREDVTHIFDRFVETPTLSSKGMKLSLCLANEIIKAHGGTITVQSDDAAPSGFVTTLRCELPLRAGSTRVSGSA